MILIIHDNSIMDDREKKDTLLARYIMIMLIWVRCKIRITKLERRTQP
jgi:hypothetical protein